MGLLFDFSMSGSLQIERAQETDEGRYECVAENSIGVTYSYSANVYVRGETPVSPKIIHIFPAIHRPRFCNSAIVLFYNCLSFRILRVSRHQVSHGAIRFIILHPRFQCVVYHPRFQFHPKMLKFYLVDQ